MKDDANDPLSDARLSSAYRALATERTPKALNDKILEQAAADVEVAQPARSFFAVWSKPLGWAATIALSLGIVLQVTQPPNTASDGPVEHSTLEADRQILSDSNGDEMIAEDIAMPEPPARSLRAEFAPQSQDVIEDAKKLAKLQAGPNLSELPESEPSAFSDSDVAGAVQHQRERKEADNASSFEERSSFAPAALVALPEESPQSICDAQSQSDPDLWAQCIDELRDTGEIDAAEQEERLLKVKFPDHATE